MIEQLQSWIELSNISVLSALLLGLLTAINPCALATNITATAYIAKEVKSPQRSLLESVMYTIGRAITYTVIGLILYFGASQFHLATFMNHYGEKILAPLLILAGLIMLRIIKFSLFTHSHVSEQWSEKLKKNGTWGALGLGILFALAFCPYSGAIYFGVLIPMTIASPEGLYLPIVYAIGTSLPVFLFSYLLAFTTNKVSAYYNKITQIEKVVRIIAGILFLAIGVYYAIIMIIPHTH